MEEGGTARRDGGGGEEEEEEGKEGMSCLSPSPPPSSSPTTSSSTSTSPRLRRRQKPQRHHETTKDKETQELISHDLLGDRAMVRLASGSWRLTVLRGPTSLATSSAAALQQQTKKNTATTTNTPLETALAKFQRVASRYDRDVDGYKMAGFQGEPMTCAVFAKQLKTLFNLQLSADELAAFARHFDWDGDGQVNGAEFLSQFFRIVHSGPTKWHTPLHVRKWRSSGSVTDALTREPRRRHASPNKRRLVAGSKYTNTSDEHWRGWHEHHAEEHLQRDGSMFLLIERCHDCANHTNVSHHDEKAYSDAAELVEAVVKEAYPHVVCRSVKTDIHHSLWRGGQRLGALEAQVWVRGKGAESVVSFVLHSKLRSQTWPARNAMRRSLLAKLPMFELVIKPFMLEKSGQDKDFLAGMAVEVQPADSDMPAVQGYTTHERHSTAAPANFTVKLLQCDWVVNVLGSRHCSAARGIPISYEQTKAHERIVLEVQMESLLKLCVRVAHRNPLPIPDGLETSVVDVSIVALDRDRCTSEDIVEVAVVGGRTLTKCSRGLWTEMRRKCGGDSSSSSSTVFHSQITMSEVGVGSDQPYADCVLSATAEYMLPEIRPHLTDGKAWCQIMAHIGPQSTPPLLSFNHPAQQLPCFACGHRCCARRSVSSKMASRNGSMRLFRYAGSLGEKSSHRDFKLAEVCGDLLKRDLVGIQPQHQLLKPWRNGLERVRDDDTVVHKGLVAVCRDHQPPPAWIRHFLRSGVVKELSTKDHERFCSEEEGRTVSCSLVPANESLICFDAFRMPCCAPAELTLCRKTLSLRVVCQCADGLPCAGIPLAIFHSEFPGIELTVPASNNVSDKFTTDGNGHAVFHNVLFPDEQYSAHCCATQSTHAATETFTAPDISGTIHTVHVLLVARTFRLPLRAVSRATGAALANISIMATAVSPSSVAEGTHTPQTHFVMPESSVMTDENGYASLEWAGLVPLQLTATGTHKVLDDRALTAEQATQFAEIRRRVADCGGKFGPVTVSLMWARPEIDLDLHVIDPSGEELSFASRSSVSGGELDIDMNCSENQYDLPIENVVWRGAAPFGSYSVSVMNNGPDSSPPCSFVVSVKSGTVVGVFSGEACAGCTPVDVIRFTYGVAQGYNCFGMGKSALGEGTVLLPLVAEEGGGGGKSGGRRPISLKAVGLVARMVTALSVTDYMEDSPILYTVPKHMLHVPAAVKTLPQALTGNMCVLRGTMVAMTPRPRFHKNQVPETIEYLNRYEDLNVRIVGVRLDGTEVNVPPSCGHVVSLVTSGRRRKIVAARQVVGTDGLCQFFHAVLRGGHGNRHHVEVSETFETLAARLEFFPSSCEKSPRRRIDCVVRVRMRQFVLPVRCVRENGSQPVARATLIVREVAEDGTRSLFYTFDHEVTADDNGYAMVKWNGRGHFSVDCVGDDVPPISVSQKSCHAVGMGQGATVRLAERQICTKSSPGSFPRGAEV